MKYLENIFKKKYSPIGLEISDNFIRMVQLTGSNGLWRLYRIAHEEFRSEGQGSGEGTAHLAGILKDMIKKHSFSGRDVFSTLSNRNVDILPVRLRENEEGGLEEKIIENARNRLPYSVDEAVIDYLPIEGLQRSEEEGRPFWIIAAQRHAVVEHLALVKAGGLRCRAIDIQPCALLKAVGSDEKSLEGKSLLIHMGERESLYLLMEHGRLLAERICLKGFQDMADKIQKDLNINMQGAIRLLADYGFEDRAAGSSNGETQTGDNIGIIVQEVIYPVFQDILEGLKSFFTYCNTEIMDLRIERVYLSGRAGFVRNMDTIIEKIAETKTNILNPLKPICLNVEAKNFIIRNSLFEIRYSFLSKISSLSDYPD